jgi:hypothetical protein
MSEKLGIKFSEVMSGGFALGETDPATGEQRGNSQGITLTMSCQITVDDLQSFVQDPQHPGNLSATVDFAPLGTGIVCDPGIFKLFCPGDSPQERFMVYQLGFAANNQRYFLAGKKIVEHNHATEVFQETTTLFTILYQGNDVTGKIAGAGTLHINAKNLADMLKTVHVTNAQNHFQTLQGMAMFLKLFLGELWHTYI